MGDYYSKINKVEENARHFMVSLFNRAKEQHLTSSEISEAYLNYRETINLNKYPRYVSSYITGLHDSLQTVIHNENLEFCYVIEGEVYSIDKDSSRYYGEHFSAKEVYEKAEKSGHFWKESDDPYYMGKHEK
jgi:hypothetical protein